MTDNSQRNRRIRIAIVAALSSVAAVVPIVAVLLTPGILFDRQDQTAASTTTTTAPRPLTIKPLALRPVIGPAYVPQGDDCARRRRHRRTSRCGRATSSSPRCTPWGRKRCGFS